MTNILILPSSGFCGSNADIAAKLRELADTIEQEEPVRTVIALVENADGKLWKETYGGVCDHARATGLMAIAITREL